MVAVVTVAAALAITPLMAPATLLKRAQESSRLPLLPQEAEAVYSELRPYLAQFPQDGAFAVACELIVEKLRHTDGMLERWRDLQAAFPDNMTALRMLMRWYRRSRQLDEGHSRLLQIVPDGLASVEQAERRALGYMELCAFAELDAFMMGALAAFPAARSLRVDYVGTLMRQGKASAAAVVAKSLGEVEKLGPAARSLIERAINQGNDTNATEISDDTAVLGELVRHFGARTPGPLARGKVGKIVFFTGQLGAGGAERQMTRIASGLQGCWEAGQRQFGTIELGRPPSVCVRHVTPSSGADFFLPVLSQSRTDLHVLTDSVAEEIDFVGETPAVRGMFAMLPEDIQVQTKKLVPLFRRLETDVAYLWQDGAILSGALAAILAGVPRIVTSFRGLPPSIRPELMRPQMPALYRALSQLPQVRFSANSQATASAYEDWLELPNGSVSVLYNAVPLPQAHGNEDETAVWGRICAASPGARQTVLGIFRFDQNKRPEMWVRVAAAFAKANPQVRFVILGSGTEFARCAALIQELGAADQVFLAGNTRNVGFFLHRSDLVMHLARHEGLPNVLIEAQMAGKAVLATPAGGTAEVVLDGQTGLLLPDSLNPDPDDILQALSRLLLNPAQLAQMGTEGARQASNRFLLDSALAAMMSLFHSKPMSRSAR